jgi:hypothetical protein
MERASENDMGFWSDLGDEIADVLDDFFDDVADIVEEIVDDLHSVYDAVRRWIRGAAERLVKTITRSIGQLIALARSRKIRRGIVVVFGAIARFISYASLSGQMKARLGAATTTLSASEVLSLKAEQSITIPLTSAEKRLASEGVLIHSINE